MAVSAVVAVAKVVVTDVAVVVAMLVSLAVMLAAVSVAVVLTYRSCSSSFLAMRLSTVPP